MEGKYHNCVAFIMDVLEFYRHICVAFIMDVLELYRHICVAFIMDVLELYRHNHPIVVQFFVANDIMAVLVVAPYNNSNAILDVVDDDYQTPMVGNNYNLRPGLWGVQAFRGRLSRARTFSS